MQAHTHSVVDVRPLGSVIEFGAVSGEAVHEVASLHEVIEHELTLHGTILTSGPARAE